MNLSKRIILIVIAVLVLLIGGGIAVATNTPKARVERQLNLGNKYLQEGKYQEAILAFRKVIEIEPKNIPARMGLGKVYVATNEYGKAKSVLKEVISIDQKNIPAREDLFNVYLKEGNLDAANTILQEIIQIDPNYKDIKQLIDNLENAKAGNTQTPSSLSAIGPTDEPDLKERMTNIIYTKTLIDKLISQGPGMGHKLACYFDSKKNIAYFGKFTSEQNSQGVIGKNIVIRVHNPKFYPISVIPEDNSNEAFVYAKKLIDQYKVTQVMEFKAPDHNNAFFPVIIEGNDFEGDLLEAGLQSNELVYIDF